MKKKPKPKANLTAGFYVRCQDHQKKELREKAKKAGVDFSKYVRWKLWGDT